MVWVGYQIYVFVMKIKDQVEKQMGDKNMVFIKDGFCVSVKNVKDELYLDVIQSWFVKVWDLSGNVVDILKCKRYVVIYIIFFEVC